jgi:hypothetical protein
MILQFWRSFVIFFISPFDIMQVQWQKKISFKTDVAGKGITAHGLAKRNG